MNQEKMLLIHNTQAEKAQFENTLSDIVKLYTEHGYIVTVCPTQREEDVANLVTKYADQHEMIVCCGNDGTVNEVMKGLIAVENRPTIGYIPSGTVHDFASSLNISKDMMTAAQTVIDGTPFACDVGTFNGQVFGSMAAFGLFASASRQPPQEMKNILSRMTYLLEGAKRLGHIPSYPFTVKTERSTIHDEFVCGMITNSTTIGGFKESSNQKVQLDDGVFEVTLARKPKNLTELHALLQCVATARPDPDYLFTCQAKSIEITSETPVEWSLDGKLVGSRTQVAIENHKQAVQIMTGHSNQQHLSF